MALKLFGNGPNPPDGKGPAPSLVDDLRDLSLQLQTRIEQAIRTAAPMEAEGQYFSRLLDEGLQAVNAKARVIDERLDELKLALLEERQRREDSDERWRKTLDRIQEERMQTREQSRVALDATVALQEEVNKLGRHVFRSSAASESAVDCLREALEDLREEARKRDRQAEDLGTVVGEVREEIRRRMIAGILPVLDSLEEGVRFGQEGSGDNGRRGLPFLRRRETPEEDREALVEGFSLVKRRLERVLQDEGAERIDCVGKTFDPSLHRAVGVEESEDHPADTVLREERPGFVLRGSVIRFSEVVISK